MRTYIHAHIHTLKRAIILILRALLARKANIIAVIISNIQFLPRQAFTDDEASTGFLQILLFLLVSTAFHRFIPYSVRSSFAVSIHFFGCLSLLLVPSTCPYSAATGSLFPFILVTFPNHVSLLFLVVSIKANILSHLLSGNLVPYLVSSGPPQNFPQPAFLCHQRPPVILLSQVTAEISTVINYNQ